jgi:translation initiation factor 2 alpha subunit (eIF-2alpha)
MSNKKETTLEEFAEKLARAFDNDNYKALMDLVIDGAKWQAERMYSEEDMIAIVEKSRETGLTAEFLLLTEQFKKK